MRHFGILWAGILLIVWAGSFQMALAERPIMFSSESGTLSASYEEMAAAMTPRQNSCGIVDSPQSLRYPVDPEEFYVIQPFARPNARFDGMLHTGDDWIRKEGETLGAPVVAIADGIVTYSNPTGWGRDRGVVIMQHNFADGNVFFSLYGHIQESDTYKFPARNTCVLQGTVVGVISDPRPAPHLHFEIRNFWATYPGPGYWEVNPTLQGWEAPRQFTANWKAWLNPAHRWHKTLDDQSGPQFPPITREDGVTVLLDGQHIKAYDATGGRLWQLRLADSITPVGFTPQDTRTVLVASADGRIQFWDLYGSYRDQWVTGLTNITHLMTFGTLYLIQDEQQALHVFDQNRQLLTRYESVARITAYAANNETIALLTQDFDVLLLKPDGSLINRFDVLPNSDLTVTTSGVIFLRNQGNIEAIAPDGTRTIVVEDWSVNRTDARFEADDNGNLILWGMQGKNILTLLTPEGQVMWTTEISQEISNPVIRQLNASSLVIADQTGYMILIDAVTGTVDGWLDLWGTYQNQVWVGTFTGDNLLRIAISSQLAAFDLTMLKGQAPATEVR